MSVDLDKLRKAVSAASAKRQASGAAPKAIDKFVNPSYFSSAQPKPNPNVSGMSAGAASKPSSGPKTVYLQSGGYVNLDKDGKIVGHGGQLNNQQMSLYGSTGSTGDFNSNLDKEYAAGKILNTFDFIPGKGTDYSTGTTDYSPFAVDLKTAAMNAGQSSGMSAQAAGAQQQQVSAPTGSIPSGSFNGGSGFTNFNPSSNNYASQAAARTAAALARKQTIAEQQKASADAAFEKQNRRTNDNRVLQDFTRQETVNPFSGRTSFENALIGRERTQADADAAAALATQKGNIDALLADYQNATAEEQVRIADELERADRAYQLQLAQFNRGNFESDRDFNYRAGQDELSNQQAAEAARAAQEQQAFENRFRYGSAIGQFNNGQKTVQQQQIEYQQARDKIADEQDKRDFDEQVRQNGVDAAISWYNAKTSRQNADRLANEAREQPPASLSAKESTNNYNEILDDIDSLEIPPTKEELRKTLMDNSAFLTDADYKKLNDYFNNLLASR